MFRKTIITGLIAAVAVPGVAVPTASAQSNREWRERRDDRRDIRQDRREDRRDDRRDARRDWRDDRGDRDRRWGRNDWRGWRDNNRSQFARGSWRAPFRYNSFRPGVRIAPRYYGSAYYINDPWRYRLAPAGRFQRWVRHYDDLILVDTRRGVVIDVIRNFYW